MKSLLIWVTTGSTKLPKEFYHYNNIQMIKIYNTITDVRKARIVSRYREIYCWELRGIIGEPSIPDPMFPEMIIAEIIDKEKFEARRLNDNTNLWRNVENDQILFHNLNN